MLIGKVAKIASEISVVDLDIHSTTRHQSGIFFDLSIVPGHRWPNGGIHNSPVLNQLPVLKPVIRDSVGSMEFFIELIIAELKTDELKDKKTCRKSDAEPKHIDCGKNFAFEHIAKGHDKIAPYHMI